MPLSALRFVYTLPRRSEELFLAELWQRGTLGVESRDGPAADQVRLEAYFPPLPDGRRAFAAPGESGRRLGAVLDRIDEIPERDWLAVWRAAAVPFAVGRRFLFDPREPGEPEREGPEWDRSADEPPRWPLRLPARGAFGTGSHETTRLAVELLEGLGLSGRTVLDVGTGTGVLALVASALGARRVSGCDIDPVATFHAAENLRLNAAVLALPSHRQPTARSYAAESAALSAEPSWWAGTTVALAPTASFDVVAVNVLPERILPELPRLARAVAPGGSLIYSGALTATAEGGTGIDRMAARFAALGLGERRRRTAGEWTALELGRG